MSNKSNNQGRAYELACLTVLEREIAKVRNVIVQKNSSYEAALNAWNTLDLETQSLYKRSCEAAVESIFQMEPRILENGTDCLELLIQKDQHGEEGDVRDVLIIRRNISWEIGLSLKHKHFAVKHSRLSRRLDFGQSWYGNPCSQDYWNKVSPIFNYLQDCKEKKIPFAKVSNKDQNIYIPILDAFIKEITYQYSVDKSIPSKLVEYLLGKFDFYKVVSEDAKLHTLIQTFNIHGTLNQDGEKTKAKISVPHAALPTRIVSLDYKPDSNTTVELYMDGGWQFSFRIHNASTICEPSLKFDVQIIGMPVQIISITAKWK